MTNLKTSESDALGGMSREELARVIRMRYMDAIHLEGVRRELTEKFPRQWVAVLDSKIIGPASTPEALRAMVRERGLDPTESTFAFLDPDEQVWIL